MIPYETGKFLSFKSRDAISPDDGDLTYIRAQTLH